MRRLGIILAASGLLALGALPAHASPPTPENPAGRALGIVPVHGQSNHRPGGGTNLSYHSGPVTIGTLHTFAIYWNPSNSGSFSSTYQSIINRFFTDVAADSSKTSNVYYSDTQYYNGSNAHISYSQSFAGSIVDTTAASSGCSSNAGGSLCVSDAQIQAEVQHVVSANSLPTGANYEYFVFLANGDSTCDGSSCAFTQFCAYHSSTAVNGHTVLYANMPYTGHNLSACSGGNSPNGDAGADATINVTSHEANESITDPFGTAWFDSQGNENGDKCAWNFGSALGGTSGAQYNQSINGSHYELQQEWSNAHSGCVLTNT